MVKWLVLRNSAVLTAIFPSLSRKQYDPESEHYITDMSVKSFGSQYKNISFSVNDFFYPPNF